jgi:hypothetical protein
MTPRGGRNLVFCNRYSTKACVTGNGGVRSPWDNVASSEKDGNPIARSGCDCQHQSGRELESDGMVNKCESLINVVTYNKPKMLTGLSQKASSQEQELCFLLSQTMCYRRRGETYPIHGRSGETW